MPRGEKSGGREKGGGLTDAKPGKRDIKLCFQLCEKWLMVCTIYMSALDCMCICLPHGCCCSTVGICLVVDVICSLSSFVGYARLSSWSRSMCVL